MGDEGSAHEVLILFRKFSGIFCFSCSSYGVSRASSVRGDLPDEVKPIIVVGMPCSSWGCHCQLRKGRTTVGRLASLSWLCSLTIPWTAISSWEAFLSLNTFWDYPGSWFTVCKGPCRWDVSNNYHFKSVGYYEIPSYLRKDKILLDKFLW